MQWKQRYAKHLHLKDFAEPSTRECLRHALQYSLSLNTHKGPISKAANTAPTNDLSLITMPTKTQCVLIGKEQDRKPTAAFVRTEVLSSFFPLLTVRGDAKLGFKFKFLLKINVRLPVYPRISIERGPATNAVRFLQPQRVKVEVSNRSGK